MQLTQPHTARKAFSSGGPSHSAPPTAARSDRRCAPQASKLAAVRTSIEGLTPWRQSQWLRSRGQGTRCSKTVLHLAAAGSGGSLEFSTVGPPGRSGVASFSAATGEQPSSIQCIAQSWRPWRNMPQLCGQSRWLK